MDCLRQEKDGSLIIRIFVQPRSSKSEVLGFHGDALKVRTTAPPVDGKANTAIVKLLAILFGIPKSAVTLKNGAQSRHKSFQLQGITRERALTKLAHQGIPDLGAVDGAQGEKP